MEVVTFICSASWFDCVRRTFSAVLTALDSCDAQDFGALAATEFRPSHSSVLPSIEVDCGLVSACQVEADQKHRLRSCPCMALHLEMTTPPIPIQRFTTQRRASLAAFGDWAALPVSSPRAAGGTNYK